MIRTYDDVSKSSKSGIYGNGVFLHIVAIVMSGTFSRRQTFVKLQRARCGERNGENIGGNAKLSRLILFILWYNVKNIIIK